jgi:uncharacterized protein (UPF0548 family)
VLRFTRPTPQDVSAFLEAQRTTAFSYAEVGASRSGVAPPGYTVDRNRIQLGVGEGTFLRAVAALRAWKMSSHGWSTIHPNAAPIAPGETVAVVAHHYGFWSLNACRIVYVRDDDVGGIRSVGFAYGTLPEHGVVGEERFTIEWHATDDGVWYDLYAFSRPAHPLARLGYPFARRLQRRFARVSKRAMLDLAQARADAQVTRGR